MPKLVLLACAIAALFGCAGSPAGPLKAAEPPPSPESDLFAPGMIPVECETILQKSQEWSYRPGEKWEPASEAQALEVARFLAEFTVIPEKTSRFLQSWRESSAPRTEAEAVRKLELMSRAQSCDVFLPQAFFEGLFAFRWNRETRPELSRSLHAFIANQQSRTSFLLPRAVSLFLFHQGVKRGLLKMQRGTAKDLVSLQNKLERDRALAQQKLGSEITAEAPPTSLQVENAMRKEMELAESLREQISRYLALP